MKNIRAKVFISCGQRKGEDEQNIAHQIKERLGKKGFEPYVAIEEHNLGGLRANIFAELSSSEYFLFIDFKREQLDKSQEHRGSLFCNQELAIASFLDMKVLGFQEKGVRQEDGILQALQTNLTPFTDKDNLAYTIAGKIEEEVEANWKNQLVMERDPSQFTNAHHGGINRAARFFHITVRNLNPQKHAKNCYAFLEEVHDLSTGDHLLTRSTELKWAAYTLPNATILPASYREIDAFCVPHDSPDTLIFHVFSDFSGSIPLIKAPGDYELTYMVISDNFDPIKSTFRMHMSKSLDDIKFEQIEC